MMHLMLILCFFSIGISQEEGYIDSSKVRNPKLAWKLALIPGLGQLYNGKYLKAVGFSAGGYIAASRFNQYRKNNSIELRNTYSWWIIGLYVFSMLDAYVDAQLSTFPVKRLEFNNEVDSLRVPLE